MAKLYSMIIDAPIEAVWAFLKDFDHWAPLIPGYVTHKIWNSRKSSWIFTTEIGVIKKKIEFDLEIHSMHAPRSITFQVEGTNEGFIGHGNIEAKKMKRGRTFITASLDLQATGPLAKLIKPLLKSNPPKITQEFKEEVTARIHAYHNG
ncbi:CoxG family protein [Robertmurraya andreesenii]|uniref:Carbon monoxide dehydrogenase subunit G n=1 Tax=Anoxybacillus andreesenii TaxID=1325932 RepID=A0ABT9V1G4_9BACL|nr:SRPBCC domain-containing protein [Robertmurraya andreesenii]MDQ0154794.1 carbon monoxide dehydrogenase subunit G [Robertmurraya andreesenii]